MQQGCGLGGRVKDNFLAFARGVLEGRAAGFSVKESQISIWRDLLTFLREPAMTQEGISKAEGALSKRERRDLFIKIDFLVKLVVLV